MAIKNPDSPTPAQLRKVREAAGLTQSQAAACLFVSLRTWQNWESGKHQMHPFMWDSFRTYPEQIALAKRRAK